MFARLAVLKLEYPRNSFRAFSEFRQKHPSKIVSRSAKFCGIDIEDTGILRASWILKLFVRDRLSSLALHRIKRLVRGI